jgi:hypothetical protein
MINQYNFFSNTKGRFIQCELPFNLSVDFTSKDTKKEISSTYSYTKEGVYRTSNHWGGVASCQWNLDTVNDFGMDVCKVTKVKTGYISFSELELNKKMEIELLNAYGNDSKFNTIKESIKGMY